MIWRARVYGKTFGMMKASANMPMKMMLRIRLERFWSGTRAVRRAMAL